jgi:plasmid stabilization system protein ParE
MKVFFHPEAEAELNQAIDWYEAHSPGLGGDFADEVRAAVERALALPFAWSEILPGIRRVLTRRFPYGVLYAQERDALQVLAVMHLSQRPGYWALRR